MYLRSNISQDSTTLYSVHYFSSTLDAWTPKLEAVFNKSRFKNNRLNMCQAHSAESLDRQNSQDADLFDLIVQAKSQDKMLESLHPLISSLVPATSHPHLHAIIYFPLLSFTSSVLYP